MRSASSKKVGNEISHNYGARMTNDELFSEIFDDVKKIKHALDMNIDTFMINKPLVNNRNITKILE